jgi:hypothetical protein
VEKNGASAGNWKILQHYGITEDFSSITCTSPFDAITAYDLQDNRCSV